MRNSKRKSKISLYSETKMNSLRIKPDIYLKQIIHSLDGMRVPDNLEREKEINEIQFKCRELLNLLLTGTDAQIVLDVLNEQYGSRIDLLATTFPAQNTVEWEADDTWPEIELSSEKRLKLDSIPPESA